MIHTPVDTQTTADGSWASTDRRIALGTKVDRGQFSGPTVVKMQRGLLVLVVIAKQGPRLSSECSQARRILHIRA